MQQGQAIRVVIADDHPVIRDSLATRFGSVAGLEVAEQVASFEELLRVLPRAQANAVVLDLQRMGGSPLKVAERLCRDFSSVGVVLFSSATELVPELLKTGILGCVSKTDPVSELITAIQFVAAGRRYISPSIEDHLEKVLSQGEITERELTVCQMVAGGYETDEIGDWLSIDTRTAQNMITGLYRKTGTRNRVQLAEWYRRTFGSE